MVLGQLEVASQLITTLHDLGNSYNQKTQIDVILDFSKAFDTVPHNRLLGKLEHYGVYGKIVTWISNLKKNRKQCVVVWLYADDCLQ